MHRHTQTGTVPKRLPHTSFILILSLPSHTRCRVRGRERWSQRRHRGAWGRRWRRGERMTAHAEDRSPLPSEVLIQPAEVQTTTHTCLLLSILLRARRERKWLPAVLPPQGSFPHINTFTAQLHLLHTLKTHTQGEPEAVNDGRMQNRAHLQPPVAGTKYSRLLECWSQGYELEVMQCSLIQQRRVRVGVDGSIKVSGVASQAEGHRF